MGISDVFPLLEKSSRSCHISEFRGQTVAVDSSCWLRQGARNWPMPFPLNDNSEMTLLYCMRNVELLLSYDITPIMVFDGNSLPPKLDADPTEKVEKPETRRPGVECLELEQIIDASKFFRQNVEVKPRMVLELIRECRKIKVDCIVAPYEAHAQIGFFDKNEIIECVISEDPELLLYGCKKVLYGMSRFGSGLLVEADKLYKSLKMQPEQYSLAKFRHLCLLSDCKYLDHEPGIVLIKALNLVTMVTDTNPVVFLGNLGLPKEYIDKFLITDATYKHETVFNPFLRKLVRLSPVNEGDLPYCTNSGKVFDNALAYQQALGNLNPQTMEVVDDWDPERALTGADNSIWSRYYTPRRRSTLPSELGIRRSTRPSNRAKKLSGPTEFMNKSHSSTQPFVEAKDKLHGTPAGKHLNIVERFFTPRSPEPDSSSSSQNVSVTSDEGYGVGDLGEVESNQSNRSQIDPQEHGGLDMLEVESNRIINVEDDEINGEEVVVVSVENLGGKRKLEESTQEPKDEVDLLKKMKMK